LAADGYAAGQQASLAVRCLRPILKWGSAPGRLYVPVELTRIVASAKATRRDRVLTRGELSLLLPALRRSERPYAAALKLMLLTLCRREEVCRVRWRDVDLAAATVTITAPKRTKNNSKPHVVPLSHQAIRLLQTQCPAIADGKPAQADALIFSTFNGGALGNWDRETKRLIIVSGLGAKDPKTGLVTMDDGSSRWTRHDLRRTGATMLGEMGELPDIVEAALNHTSIRSALAATYNRSRYRPQVAAALQRLADALDGIEAGAGEVIPLRSAGGDPQ
jgi:integrase